MISRMGFQCAAAGVRLPNHLFYEVAASGKGVGLHEGWKPEPADRVVELGAQVAL
jgi:hypothetical protein